MCPYFIINVNLRDELTAHQRVNSISTRLTRLRFVHSYFLSNINKGNVKVIQFLNAKQLLARAQPRDESIFPIDSGHKTPLAGSTKIKVIRSSDEFLWSLTFILNITSGTPISSYQMAYSRDVSPIVRS
jgi:hypothetical protein